MRQFKILTVLSLCSIFTAHAQIDPNAYGYYERAHLFSQSDMAGSARTRAMGGAQVAVGGDPGSVHVNPAGLGVMRSGRFDITLNTQVAGTNSEFSNVGDDNSTIDLKPGLNIPSLSLILAEAYDNPESNRLLKNQAFGFSINREYNFSNKFSYSGENLTGYNYRDALMQDIVSLGLTSTELANSNSIYGAAYNSNAILSFVDEVEPGEFVENNVFFTPDAPGGANVVQEENIDISGAKYETALSYGGNYDDVVFFGFSLGIPRVRYTLERTFTETVDPGNQYDLDYIELQETEQTTGTGANASLGVILKPFDFMRVGASVKSPSFMYMTEYTDRTFTAEFNYDYIDLEDYDPSQSALLSIDPSNEIELDQNKFNYTTVTPMHANLGAAFFIKKSGFISADFEYVPYGSARVTSSQYSLSGDNNTISDLYANAWNVRVGAEYRYKVLRIRLGYVNNGNSFNSSTGLNNSVSYFTGGFGVKHENKFFDIAVVNSQYSDSYQPYALVLEGDSPQVDFSTNLTQVMLTLGVSF